MCARACVCMRVYILESQRGCVYIAHCALLSSEEGRYMYMYTIKQHNIHVYTYTCKAGVGQVMHIPC